MASESSASRSLTPSTVLSPTISTGTIIEISSDGRYGFIEPDCGGIEVFFHVTNCLYGYTPCLHGRVSYLTRLSEFPGRRSCFTAIDLDYGDGEGV